MVGMQILIFTLFFTINTLAVSTDNETDIKQRIEEINIHLYGEPHPNFLKYVNDDGVYVPSPTARSDEPRALPSISGPVYNATATTQFWLYTRENRNKHKIVLNDAATLNSSMFNSSNEIRFLIHGWLGNVETDMIQIVKDAYLEKGDFNIIAVDWGAGATTLNYYKARHRVTNVANVTSRFIAFLVKQTGVKINQIQLIGHSLGAHIAGLTGKYLTPAKLPVIVGLDPALPLFSFKKPEHRLNATDAEIVEVIHTNAGLLGFDVPIGTTDIYCNDRGYQPGCGLDFAGSCSHARAYEVFAESIITKVVVWAHECINASEIYRSTCVKTGFKMKLAGGLREKLRRGVFHLITNRQKPYLVTDESQ